MGAARLDDGWGDDETVGKGKVSATRDPEAVRAFLHGARPGDARGKSGAGLERWDVVDEEIVKRADKLTRCAAILQVQSFIELPFCIACRSSNHRHGKIGLL